MIRPDLIPVTKWKKLECQKCGLGLSAWITIDEVVSFIFCSVCLQKVRSSGSPVAYITEEKMEEIEKSRKKRGF